MIFKKISICVLLIICTLYSSESHHVSKRCACSNYAIPHQYQPYTYQQPYPTNYFPKDIDERGTSFHNIDPHVTEALLKNMWLSQHFPNVRRKNPDFSTKLMPDGDLLEFHTIQLEDYLNNPDNHVINKVFRQQNDGLTESKLPYPSVFDKHERYIYGKSVIDSKENKINDDKNTDTNNYVLSNDNNANDKTNGIDENGTDVYNKFSDDIDTSELNEVNDIDDTKDSDYPYDDSSTSNEYHNGDDDKQDYDNDNHPRMVLLGDVIGKHKYRYDSNNVKKVVNIPFREKYSSETKLSGVGFNPNVIKYQQKYIPTSLKTHDLKNKIPYNHDSEEILNIKEIGNYDEFKGEAYRSKFSITGENLDNSVKLKYDPTNMLKEERYYIPASHIAPNRKPVTQQVPGKFTNWISEQIKLLNNKNKESDKIDLSGLGYSVLQILIENGMYITDDGMLIDTYGTISSIDTLDLTPILIGDTMPLKHLLKSKYKAMSSIQTPYIVAILVTNSHPFKILGVVPFESTYLPLSTLNGVTDIWHENLKIPSSKETERKFKNVLKLNEPKLTNIYRPEKISSIENDHKGQLSNYLSTNDNNYNFRPYHKHSISPTRLGNKLPEVFNSDDSPCPTKIIENEDESNGRFFIPRIEIQEQPIDVLTRRQNKPLAVLVSGREPARIHIPGVSSLFDIAFRSEKAAGNNVKTTHNKAEAENKEQAGTFLENNDAISAVKKVINTFVPSSVLDKDLNGRLQIIQENVKPIFEMKKNILQSIPFDKSVMQHLKHYLPSEDVVGVSKSGVVPPEIPPESDHNNNNYHDGNHNHNGDSNHNGNHAFDIMENSDDDGDFRIIGGNAATGSGTPLSNKGRSGYIF